LSDRAEPVEEHCLQRRMLKALLSDPPASSSLADLSVLVGCGEDEARDALIKLASLGLLTARSRHGLDDLRITARVALFVGDFATWGPLA